MTESESVALPLGDAALFEQYVLYHIFLFCQYLWGDLWERNELFSWGFWGCKEAWGGLFFQSQDIVCGYTVIFR